MSHELKSDDAYRTIGEITKALGLIDKTTGNLQTHTLRYWEKQFKQIRPSIRAGGRRYYSEKNIRIIKIIKSLLKERGLTIKGVKKILNQSKSASLDANIGLGVYKHGLESTNIIKSKIKKISKIIEELKQLK